MYVWVIQTENSGETDIEVFGSKRRAVEWMESYAMRVDMGESDAWTGDGSKRPGLDERAQRASGALSDADTNASMILTRRWVQ